MGIVDRREIEFDADGLAQAIASAVKSAQPVGLPGLPPDSFRFCPEQGLVRLIYGAGPAARSIELPGAALGALLISYCVRARMPMPRYADKTIRVERNAVVLAFRTPGTSNPASQAAEGSAQPASQSREVGWSVAR